MNDENVWHKFDKIISHFVRNKNMNMAVDAGIVRDAHLKELDELVSIAKDVYNLEKKRITDNNDYISIPIEDWNNFKKRFR